MKPSKLFCFKYTRRYYFFLAAGIKISQRANATAVRVTDANKSIRRLVEDGMSRGLTCKHAHGSWILFYITCSLVNNAFSVLHYVIKVTLHYLTLHRFGIHSTWNFSPMALSGCRLAASRLVASRLLVSNYVTRRFSNIKGCLQNVNKNSICHNNRSHFSYVKLLFLFLKAKLCSPNRLVTRECVSAGRILFP